MDSTSVSLIKKLRGTDEAAWERFVNLYAPMIFQWGKFRGLSSTDAADLVQDVMQVMITKLPTFEYEPGKSFRGWLRQVTVNKANDYHRIATREPTKLGGDAVMSLSAESDIDLFAEAEYQKFLAHRAMELMKTEFDQTNWQACCQNLMEGKPAAQVAANLGITVNQVYLAKSRILARIREELNGLLD